MGLFRHATVAALMIAAPIKALGPNDMATCGVHPDPHFHTWDNVWYDYHGACDLVLIQNERLEMHISTKPMGGYSGIDKAVVNFDNAETIEITDLGQVLIDGTVVTGSLPATVAGYGLVVTPLGGASTEYKIVMPFDQSIAVTKFQHGLDILVTANGRTFAGSEGMCGSWDNGGITDRNGIPFPFNDSFEWAKEWQVTYGEHAFFEPHVAGECTPPPGCSRRFPEGNFPCDELDDLADLVADETQEQARRDDIKAAMEEAKEGGNLDEIRIAIRLAQRQGLLEKMRAAITQVQNVGPGRYDAIRGAIQEYETAGGGRRLGGVKGLRKLQDATGIAPQAKGGKKGCKRSCNDIPREFPEEKNNCIFDVIVSGDSSFACAPAYTNPERVIRPDDCKQDDGDGQCVADDIRCLQMGGRCVQHCVSDDVVACIPELCHRKSDYFDFGELKNEHVDDMERSECFCAIVLPPTRPVALPGRPGRPNRPGPGRDEIALMDATEEVETEEEEEYRGEYEEQQP